MVFLSHQQALEAQCIKLTSKRAEDMQSNAPSRLSDQSLSLGPRKESMSRRRDYSFLLEYVVGGHPAFFS
jgi:hypothetical protein